MPSNRPSGFSLIELVVTLAVLATLVALALPSFQETLRRNRVATATNELLASLALARTEALKGLGPAGLCASIDGATCATSTDWAAGWLVWREQRSADGIERSVVRYIQARGKVAVTGPQGGIEFTTQGRSRDGATQIGLAPDDVAAPARCVVVGATGQARAKQEACA